MKRILLIGVGLGLSLVAMAQKPDAFDEKVVDVMILQSQAVQKEVGITLKMREKMNQYGEEHGKKSKALMELAQKKGQDPTNPDVVKKSFGLYTELKTKIIALLTPSQVRRWRELSLQAAGLPALMDETVAKKIGMSAAQIQKFKSAYQNGADRYQKLQKQVFEPLAKKYNGVVPKTEKEANDLRAKIDKETKVIQDKYGPQFKKMQQETEGSMRAVLTKPQAAAFEALKGKPFKNGK